MPPKSKTKVITKKEKVSKKKVSKKKEKKTVTHPSANTLLFKNCLPKSSIEPCDLKKW